MYCGQQLNLPNLFCTNTDELSLQVHFWFKVVLHPWQIFVTIYAFFSKIEAHIGGK